MRKLIDGSVLDKILLILSLWRNHTSKTSILVSNMCCVPSMENTKKGDTKEAPRAERDDFFDANAMHIQIKQTTKPTSMLIPNMIPIKVATPFPPLKL